MSAAAVSFGQAERSPEGEKDFLTAVISLLSFNTTSTGQHDEHRRHTVSLFMKNPSDETSLIVGYQVLFIGAKLRVRTNAVMRYRAVATPSRAHYKPAHVDADEHDSPQSFNSRMPQCLNP